MQPTQRLVALGRRVQAASLPADVLLVAKHCVLDFIAVTLAGASEPLVRILYESTVRADAGLAIGNVARDSATDGQKIIVLARGRLRISRLRTRARDGCGTRSR